MNAAASNKPHLPQVVPVNLAHKFSFRAHEHYASTWLHLLTGAKYAVNASQAARKMGPSEQENKSSQSMQVKLHESWDWADKKIKSEDALINNIGQWQQYSCKLGPSGQENKK